MTYKIGQLVRILWSVTTPSLVGSVGMINEVRTGFHVALGEVTEGYGLDIAPIRMDDDGVRLVWNERQLEPVRYDGSQAGEEGRCKPLDHLLSRLKGVEA